MKGYPYYSINLKPNGGTLILWNTFTFCSEIVYSPKKGRYFVIGELGNHDINVFASQNLQTWIALPFTLPKGGCNGPVKVADDGTIFFIAGNTLYKTSDMKTYKEVFSGLYDKSSFNPPTYPVFAVNVTAPENIAVIGCKKNSWGGCERGIPMKSEDGGGVFSH